MHVPMKKILSSLAFVFLGFSLGLATNHFKDRHLFIPEKHSSTKLPEKRIKRLIVHYTTRLNLDDQQRLQVHAIISNKHKQMHILRKQIHPEFEKLFKETEDKIRLVLRPEQIHEFEEMQKRFREHNKHKRQGRLRH